MEVLIKYYTYKPRLRLDCFVNIPEPHVGDTISIPKTWFSEVGKQYKESIHYCCEMRVKSRNINPMYYKGVLLSVEMELIQ
tara:strand:+ start:202 stop:444 length:243 start_codon:yes stop_codon:yes gene_type:complete